MPKHRQLMLYMLLKIRLYTKRMKNLNLTPDEFMSYADRRLAILSTYYYTKELYKEEPNNG